MPSTLEVRRRIASVKNVAQITRALQMVASSKMRRAQERVLAARPYSEQLIKLLSRLSAEAEGQEDLPADAARARCAKSASCWSRLTRDWPARCRATSTAARASWRSSSADSTSNHGAASLVHRRRAQGARFRAAHRPEPRRRVHDAGRPAAGQRHARRSRRSSKTPISMRRWTRSIWSIRSTSPPSSRRRPSCRSCRCSRPRKSEVQGPAPQYIFEPDAETILGALLRALRRDADLSAAAGDRRQLLFGADGRHAERHR